MKTRLFRAIALLLMLMPIDIWAEQPQEQLDSPELVIKPEKKPIIIKADRISGFYDTQEMEAIGNAELRSCEDITITADRMKYFKKTEDTVATGNVHIDRPDEIMEGSHLELNLETEIGSLKDPHFQMKDGSGRGSGDLLLINGRDNYQLKNGRYTSCPKGNDDWYLETDDLVVDNDKQVATARNVKIRFKDVPILYLPWMDFSFSGERKSGMLSPIMGNTAKSGAEISLPLYLNIAPNVDATITARAMSKRGVMIGNELRYMTERATGDLRADILPNDLLTDQTRYGMSLTHNQRLGMGWNGNLIYNKVSDDRFVRDLANNLATTSRVNLLQRAAATYNGALGVGGAMNFTAEVQSFQTLKSDPQTPTASPFKRLPQFTLNTIKRNVGGLDFNFNGSWTNFSHKTRRDGKRSVMFPSVSLPLRNAFGYITPKVGLHYTRYDLSAATSFGETLNDTPDRTLPILSLDSGVVFDREMSLRGNKYTQTLEPRAFYVYIPFKDQDLLPVFDTAEQDFSFAQMFTENRFSGSDRINDANQITLALTSRLIEPNTGIERVRVAVGQQFRFQGRRVVLNTPQINSGKADFIAAISGHITSTIRTDTNVQFDEKEFRTEKIRTGISYRPEAGKVLNLGYRFTRDVFEQVDTSVQWPFAGNWHGVARINYSLKDDEMLAGLFGFEYKACCWALSFVVQRFITARKVTRTGVFVQLELNGLMDIGNNPLRTLQQSIPGYSQIN